MMGIDGGRYRSAFHCTAELVRAGGLRVLMNGVGPRVCRVFIEVGLQFSLYEYVALADPTGPTYVQTCEFAC